MYPSSSPRTTARHYLIPPGHVGIEWTVLHMRRLARRATRQPVVVDTAAALTASSRTAGAAAARIRAFLARHVVFTPDPLGVELIRSPRYMLRAIARDGWVPGDCDDAATLGAALGMAAGLGARYVLVGLTPREPFEHVYTELATENGWLELDTTRPAQMPPGVVIHRTAYREA